MEGDSHGVKKTPDRGELKLKRKMKTPSQLETLEKTYTVDTHPSEAVRDELSVKLGLTDRQLQMWFCNRRIKDKKMPLVKKLHNGSPGGAATSTPLREVGEEMLVANVGNEHVIGTVSGSSIFGNSNSWQKCLRPGRRVDLSAVKRQFEPQQAIAERRAIALVETILGKPVEDDGPILGIEFDSVPPGAFGTPIVEATMEQEQQRPSGWPVKANMCERSNGNLNKCVSRSPHEYHFLPAQLNARTETCGRVVPTYHHGSPDNITNDRTSSDRTSSDRTSYDVSSSNETAVSHHALQMQWQMPELITLSQQGRHDPLLSSAPGYHDNFLQQNSAFSIPIQPHYRQRSSYKSNNQNIISERMVIHEVELARIERKHTCEEIRIERMNVIDEFQKNLEAQEKRFRKGIEKQEILMRKREEQIRKELEIINHEKQQEEILLRERQHEEICQRVQKPELERRDKLSQKETLIAEKMKQTEELRRENEACRMKAADEREIAHKNLTILASILLGEDR